MHIFYNLSLILLWIDNEMAISSSLPSWYGRLRRGRAGGTHLRRRHCNTHHVEHNLVESSRGGPCCCTGRQASTSVVIDTDEEEEYERATVRVLTATPPLFFTWWCAVRYGLARLPTAADDGIESVILHEFGNFGIASLVMLRVLGVRTFLPLFFMDDAEAHGASNAEQHHRRQRKQPWWRTYSTATLLRGCALGIAIIALCCRLMVAILPTADAGASLDAAVGTIYMLPESRMYRTICNALALFGLCILAPLWEEVLFRGVVMRALFTSTTRLLLARCIQLWSLVSPPRRIVLAVATAAAIMLSSLIFACAHLDMRVAMLCSRSAVGIITGVAYVCSSSVSRWMEAEKRRSGGITIDDGDGDGEEAADNTVDNVHAHAMRGGDFALPMAVPVCIHAIVNWKICSEVILGAT